MVRNLLFLKMVVVCPTVLKARPMQGENIPMARLGRERGGRSKQSQGERKLSPGVFGWNLSKERHTKMLLEKLDCINKGDRERFMYQYDIKCGLPKGNERVTWRRICVSRNRIHT